MTYKTQIDDLVRDANKDEIADIKARKAQHDAEKQADADRQALKAATLAKLGLTADEIAALLS